MTLLNETSYISYRGNGVTTEFAVPFKFFDKEIVVYNKDTLEVLNNYTVINNGNGGAIIFDDPIENDTIIVIARDVELTQRIRFIEGEDFPAQDYEYSLDRIYMAIQEFVRNLNDEIERAKSKEEELETSVTTETNRAIARENELGQAISDEVTRATARENELHDEVVAERNRAELAEGDLLTNILAERGRAEAIEQELRNDVNSKQGTLTAGQGISINDGVISATGDIDAYTKEEVDDLLDAKPSFSDIPSTDNFATTTELQNVANSIPTSTSDLTNDSGFATETYVNNVLGNIETLLSEV